MDKKTLRALKASIVKWEKSAQADNTKQFLIGPDDCPLCKLYIDKGCEGCPINSKTKTIYCRNTPYEKAVSHFRKWDIAYYKDDVAGQKKYKRLALAAARREADFLRSLLPEGE